jgi:hypothetical protein
MRLNLLVSSVLAGSLLVVAPASAAGAWEVDLTAPGEGSTNVVTDGAVRLGSDDNRAASAASGLRTGFAVYSRRLATPANTFAAAVRSGVPAGAELAIDVRGWVGETFVDGARVGNGPGRAVGGSAGGQWTEWVEVRPGAPGVLPAAVTDVEVRALLSAPDGVGSPALEGLVVTPSVTERGPAGSTAAAGLAYSVFATREGLVGHTTANGHKIVPRDHFVALPSRRGLSVRRTGDYTVRVCAANGRCAWAPVWDVGPWNTRDDYWAAPGVRQEWHDLPQGKPASQAAYQDGYNNGKDQFGRKVANPAGIDLADGTFWDGLKLKNNAWVTVVYQWTGTNPAGYVRTPSDTLNVRTGPDSRSPIVGLAGNHAQVRVECVATGEQVRGTVGTTNAWYRIAAGMYVSAAYVAGGAGAPAC